MYLNGIELKISTVIIGRCFVCLGSVRTRKDRRSVKLSPTLPALGLCFALSNASFASRVNGPHLRNIRHHHLVPHKARRDLLVAILLPDRSDYLPWIPPISRSADVFAHHRLLRTGPETQGKPVNIFHTPSLCDARNHVGIVHRVGPTNMYHHTRHSALTSSSRDPAIGTGTRTEPPSATPQTSLRHPNLQSPRHRKQKQSSRHFNS